MVTLLRPAEEVADTLAEILHRGQTDKQGRPYIEHPRRVAGRLVRYTYSEDAKIAGLLHDVAEDCGVTFDQLRRLGISGEALAAIDAVTRRGGESYDDFITRAGRHPLGRLVKIADLEDNLDPARIPNPTPRDAERNAKYRAALERLTSEFGGGSEHAG